MSSWVITAVGPDRPGLVGRLTAPLLDSSSNVADSRMINLRGQFALLLLAEIPDDRESAVREALLEVARELQLDLEFHGSPESGGTGHLRGDSLPAPDFCDGPTGDRSSNHGSSPSPRGQRGGVGNPFPAAPAVGGAAVLAGRAHDGARRACDSRVARGTQPGLRRPELRRRTGTGFARLKRASSRWRPCPASRGRLTHHEPDEISNLFNPGENHDEKCHFALSLALHAFRSSLSTASAVDREECFEACDTKMEACLVKCPDGTDDARGSQLSK